MLEYALRPLPGLSKQESVLLPSQAMGRTSDETHTRTSSLRTAMVEPILNAWSPPLWNHRKETGRLGPPPATHPLLRKSSPHAQVPPVARRCRHRRRRHRRRVHRLSPHQDRHHEHGAARAQAAHLRNDLACGGPRRRSCAPAATSPSSPSTRPGCSRGWRQETGQATGFKQNGSISIALTAGSVRGGEARRLDGEELRAGGERHLDRRDQGAPAALQSRWRGRRRVPAEGRPGQSHRRDAGARRRRPQAWRQDVREHQGDAHPGRRTGAPSASRRRTARSAPTRW